MNKIATLGPRKMAVYPTLSWLLLFLGSLTPRSEGQGAIMMLRLLKKPWVLQRFKDAYPLNMRGVSKYPVNYTVSAGCMSAMNTYDMGLGQLKDWAGRMADADGVPPPGILDGHQHWTGSYEECIRVKATGDVLNVTGIPFLLTHDFDAKYCKAVWSLSDKMPPFAVGVCFPDSCSEDDITHALSAGNPTMPIHDTFCTEKDKLEDEPWAIACSAVVGCFCVVILLATLVDAALCYLENKHPRPQSQKTAPPENHVYENGGFSSPDPAWTSSGSAQNGIHGAQNGKPVTQNGNSLVHNGISVAQNGISGAQTGVFAAPVTESPLQQRGTPLKAFLAFSLYTNLPRVLSGSMPKGSYTCMNGLRSISMAWIMFGHVWLFGTAYCIGCPVNPTENFFTQFKLHGRMTSRVLSNFDLAVEAFFVMSGCLVVISFIKTLEECKGRPSVYQMVHYYVHRYLRLAPVYAMAMFMYTTLFELLGEGPSFPEEVPDAGYCEDYWWANLLYIANLYKPHQQCIGWTWFLMCEFQFYVIAPLFIFVLYKWPKAGYVFLFLGYAGQMTAKAVLHSKPIEDREPSHYDYMYEHIYVKPWTRFGSYAIGMFLGYLMYRTKCKTKIPVIVAWLGWVLALGLSLFVVYISEYYKECSDCEGWEWTWFVVYECLRRDIYALSISWAIFACCCGFGGIVDAILSWPGFAPLARLTYVTYIIHPMIIFFHAFSRMRLIYVSDLSMVFLYCGVLVLSYGCALPLSLAFEVPIVQLEKVILPRRK